MCRYIFLFIQLFLHVLFVLDFLGIPFCVSKIIVEATLTAQTILREKKRREEVWWILKKTQISNLTAH